MRQKLLFFIIISLIVWPFNNLFAQDLIVTNEGDSINCKITKVKKDYIYFTFKHKKEIRNTLLSMSDVKTHQFEYYQTSEVPLVKVSGFENYQRFRIAVNGGYSYMPAKIPENTPTDLKNYTKELKSGYHFNLDATYYFTEPLGFGFKYSVFKSKNSVDNIYVEVLDGNRRYGKMSDDITITFIGPAFKTRLLNSNKTNAFLLGLSIGYIGYTNNFVLIDDYKMTGGTVGFGFEIGYDIGLSENISLGFQLSSISGNLLKYKISDGFDTETIKLDSDEDELISTSHVDFSIGVRINL